MGSRSDRPPLILASGSPRRRELLGSLGLSFDIVVPDVDETPEDGENADRMVERLARSKAARVSASHPGSLVLAADTTVALDREILGKPADDDEARRMLRRLSGRTHEVFTGVALLHAAESFERRFLSRSIVEVVALDDARIDAYVATGEPLGKAGAYAIQSRAAEFLELREGFRSNVIGLPVEDVIERLREHPSGAFSDLPRTPSDPVADDEEFA